MDLQNKMVRRDGVTVIARGSTSDGRLIYKQEEVSRADWFTAYHYDENGRCRVDKAESPKDLVAAA